MSGNTFGTIFKLTTFGESHGVALGAIVDGCPPNIPLAVEDIQEELDRRKPGQSRYVTQRKEDDAVEILSGVFEGKTTGTPIGLIIKNKDQKSKDYENVKDKFRPGHVDMVKINELETFFQALIKDQDSVGAKILVRINGLMPGVGSPVFSKLDAELAKAMMGVNAVKAVEIGAGANVVKMRGSGNRDLMVKAGFLSNNSGGILGGISNGEDIDIYVSLKPTSSISQKTTTVNKDNEDVDLQVKGRHDPCVGLRAAPILEAMAALCILDQVLLDKGQCFNVDRDS